MATLTYYTFSKRSKSTAQPTGGTQVDVNLKDGTSLISPVFLLNYSGRPTFNYANFEGRYYFVTDIKSVRNNLWEIYCEEDYLATAKTDIGSTSAMILYASGGSDNIIDKRIPVTASMHVSSNTAAIQGITFTDQNQGTIILSVVGTGSFGTYVMEDSTKLPQLLNNFSLWKSMSITDVQTAIDQAMFGGRAGDNLKAAISLPCLFSLGGLGAATQLILGEYPCADSVGNPINVLPINIPIVKATADISIPWHYNDWRRHSPYSELFLYLPIIGTMALPTDDLINDSSLSIDYVLNITSGDIAVLIAGTQSGKIIASASANCAMATPYGSSNISGAKVASAISVGVGAIAAVAAGAVSGGAGAVALGGGLASSAAGLISAAQGESQGGGGLGGGASHGLYKDVRLSCVYRDLTDSQSSLNPILGKPVFAKHTINTYAGFVQTDGMQVQGNYLDTERQAINSLCDGGFYYE